MVLQFISPQNKYLLRAGVIHHGAVIGHLREVLNSFAAKPEYSKFYIGITNDLNRRLSQHQRTKPSFKWMCPIYEEEPNLVGNAFDRLEREAITQFSGGVKNRQTGRVLKCDNGPAGALPKTYLYILVG
jgi:hypothetical protein